MSRVALSDEMAGFLAAWIADLPDDRPDGPNSEALPLYEDPAGVIGIRPDGTLVEWSPDVGDDRAARPVEDRTMVLIALVAGARRHTRLRELLTARGPASAACDCRAIPEGLSGLFWCERCGGLGWVAEGEPCTIGRIPWPRRREGIVVEKLAGPIGVTARFLARHLVPRQYSFIVVVLLLLAVFSFYGAYIVMTGPSRGFVGNGLGLIVLGLSALLVATNGVGRPRPDRPRTARGPIFDADDPEIAALPPTSTTALSERLRLARERQKRAED